MRRKIARLYGELRFLEDEITGGGPTDAAQLMARLDQLEKQASQLRMPIAYESMMYLLRNHIGVVRNRLAAGQPFGLEHFEGRSWQGLHRHALMTMIA